MFESIIVNQRFVRALGLKPAYLLFALMDKYRPEWGKYYEINFIDISDDIAIGWGDSAEALEVLKEAELVKVIDSNVECIKEVAFIPDNFDDILKCF